MMRRGFTWVAGPCLIVLLASCGSTVPYGSQTATGQQSQISNGASLGGSVADDSRAGGDHPGQGQSLSGSRSPGTSGGGSSTSAAGGGSSTGGAGGGSVSAGGGSAQPLGTPPRSPLALGILVTKCSNCDLIGFAQSAHSDQQIWTALIRDVNASGGLEGRQIDPVFATVDTNETNWGTMFQTVCATFTQDNHVAAVLGASFVYSEQLATCLKHKSVPWLNAVTTVGLNGDEAVLRDFPYYLTGMPSDSVVTLAAVESAIADGWLTTKTRLGVVRDNCPSNMRAWNQTVKPYLDSHGIQVVDDQVGPCVNGSSDQGAASSFAQSAELHMRANNVDTVLGFSIALVLFMTNAESQHWNPKYLTAGAVAAAEGLAPNGQLANLHSAGWTPYADVNSAYRPALGAEQNSCIGKLKRGGLTGLVDSEYNQYFTACSGLEPYKRALALSHGQTSLQAMTAAIDRLGRIPSPVLLESVADFGAGRHAAAVSYRSITFAQSCTCFVYSGPKRPLPAP